MTGIRHFLIMMILCPWIGGTIIGYSGDLDSKVTDFQSAVSCFFTAMFVILIFGLLVTFCFNLTIASITYLAFMIIANMGISRRNKAWWISVITLGCSILLGFITSGIAMELKATYNSVVIACAFSGGVGAWLNSLNWLSTAKKSDIQQVSSPNDR